MKRCTKCLSEKDEKNFYTNGKNKIGYRQPCIQCTKEGRLKACVSCGNTFLPNGSVANRCPECYILYRQAYTLVSSAEYRARKKGIEFSLTTEWVMNKLKNPCPRTGVTFTFSNNGSDYSGRKPTCPSLDKIDPYKGYTPDNVQVVCWWYNVSKQQFTDAEVLEFCKRVTNQIL